MTKTIAIIALTLGLLGAAGLAGYQWLRNAELQAEVQSKTYSLETSQKQIAQLEQHLRDLQQKLDTAAHPAESPEKSESEPETAAKEEAPAPVASSEPRPDDRRERMRELMRGPAGELFANSNVSMNYADLFRSMQLSPAEKEQLRQILVNAQLARMQGGGRNNPATQAQQQAADAQIKALLGNARYSEYQTYNSQSRERAQVSQFETSIALSSSPLSAEQKAKMVQLMATQSASGNTDNQSLSNQLGTVLTPTQLAEFRKWQSATSQFRNLGGPRRPGGSP